MKSLGIIPARYHSSRFPGKPLIDLCGKPMVWWVYQQAVKSTKLEAVYVATDDERIKQVCDQYKMNVVMTSKEHATPADRIYEVSKLLNADLYVAINGDEPLISIDSIEATIPDEKDYHPFYVGCIYTDIDNPIELVDTSNIKVIINDKDECIFVSRTPIPYPKGSCNYRYKKYLGVVSFGPSALDFYVSTPRSDVEKMEEIDLFRFIEHHKIINFKKVNENSISVDTYKDFLEVKKIIMEGKK